jgi:hypothetical protein
LTPTDSTEDQELRAAVRRHIERVHRLKLHVAAYLLGMLVLTAIWAIIEWQDKGSFQRFSDGGNSGDWNPWIVYVALIWGFLLGIDVLKTHFDRPTTEADVDRELERLRRLARPVRGPALAGRPSHLRALAPRKATTCGAGACTTAASCNVAAPANQSRTLVGVRRFRRRMVPPFSRKGSPPGGHGHRGQTYGLRGK